MFYNCVEIRAKCFGPKPDWVVRCHCVSWKWRSRARKWPSKRGRQSWGRCGWGWSPSWGKSEKNISAVVPDAVTDVLPLSYLLLYLLDLMLYLLLELLYLMLDLMLYLLLYSMLYPLLYLMFYRLDLMLYPLLSLLLFPLLYWLYLMFYLLYMMLYLSWHFITESCLSDL